LQGDHVVAPVFEKSWDDVFQVGVDGHDEFLG